MGATHREFTRLILAAILSFPAATALALQIDIVAGAGLSGNTDALNAFGRAAAQWETRIADPITVTVNADLVPLASPNTIGQASSTLLIGGYDLIRDAMVADSAAETDDGIVASLPTAAGFTAFLPDGFTLGGGLIGTKANLKALGFGGLDAAFGVSDGFIEFNSNFSFDFDASDGVTGTDFETVAAHELGHALGFISIVDAVDGVVPGSPGSPGPQLFLSPTTLDLFRFPVAANLSPSNAGDFATFTRDLRPDEEVVVSDTQNAYAMSTGAVTGDGRQASHFKDDSLTGIHIGIMDPTLASGVAFPISEADFRTLDLIGYDIVAPIPVPAPLVLLLSGIAGVAAIARRRQKQPGT